MTNTKDHSHKPRQIMYNPEKLKEVSGLISLALHTGKISESQASQMDEIILKDHDYESVKNLMLSLPMLPET